MQVALWPRGLIGRVMAVLLAAVLIEFLGSILLYEQMGRYSIREDHARRVAELLVVSDRLLSGVPLSRRAEVMANLSTEHLALEWARGPVKDASQQHKSLGQIKQLIVQWEPSLANNDLRLATELRHGRRGEDLVGTLRLTDGSLLRFRSKNLLERWPLLYGTIAMASILALGVLLAAVLLVHTLGAPLRTLARAADTIGHGTSVTVLERGSGDIRKVARAFNAMQARIARLIADRTQALAAVSHDLRTPLSRLRLRASFVADPDMREMIEADIDEMEAMLTSLLGFLGGENDPEPARLTDLTALVTTLVDAATDAGHVASYEGPDHLLLTVRPVAMKRAVSNLMENAIKYGGCAHVRLMADDAWVCLTVDDEGPGIPEAEQTRVLEPFQRLDAARARDTRGLGLGLAVVARVVEREQGRLALTNRPEGGLRAEIRLPAAAQD